MAPNFTSSLARRTRIQLTTEGNYPDVVGGVTRWCDLIMAGLGEIDWEVFALGVTPTVGSRRGVGIRYPIRSTGAGRVVVDDRTGDVVDRLGRSLFATDMDPDALVESLLGLRRNPLPMMSLRRIVTDRLTSWAPPALGRSGSNGVPADALEEAVAIVTAVQDAVSGLGTHIDVNLAATVGIAALPGVLDRVLNGTPLVAVEHGVYVHEANARTNGSRVGDWRRWVVRSSATNLARLTYATASMVVGVSEANVIRSRSLGADPSRTVCIPNGVAAPAVCPSVGGLSRVASVGRVDPFKGVDLFIAAAGMVARRVPDATFLHIGPVEVTNMAYLRTCEQLSRREELTGRLAFVGMHPDPPSILADIDVQVLPSRSEGLPFSLLEGMAAGRPIIAMAVGGIPEVLSGAGLIVEPGDVEMLAAGIELLCTDLAMARRLGGLAHEAVRDMYPIERMLEGYRQAFRSVSRTGAML